MARIENAKDFEAEWEPYVETHRLPASELQRIISFIEDFNEEVMMALDIVENPRNFRAIAFLMRSHFVGRLVTPSSLVAASGLSYGSGLRAVNAMIESGDIVKRPRTESGKSVSLHPSSELIERWQECSRRVKTLIGGTFGWNMRGRGGADYFFGASYLCAQIIPELPPLTEKLDIAGRLRLLLHADATTQALNTITQRFESVLGVDISARAMSIDRLRHAVLRNSERKSSQYDLVSCNLPWIGEMASRGALRPLDDLVRDTELDLSDFHPSTIQSTRWKGQLYGIPVQTTPELLVYRRDLFEEAGIKPPRTTDELLAAAKAFNDPVRRRYGIAWNAAKGTPVGHTFLMLMADFGQPVVNLLRGVDGFLMDEVTGLQNRPMFDTPAARAAAELMLELIDYSPPTILNMSWYERAACYASGAAAMAYAYTLRAPLVEKPDSPAYGVTGYLPHPHGPGARAIAPVGGYVLAIPSNLNEKRVAAASIALRTFTSASAGKLFIENGSTVSSRFSVGGDPNVAALCPLIQVVDHMARTGLLQSWPRPPIPEMSQIVEIVGEHMHAMLRREATVDEALGFAQRDVDALMRANGHY